MKRENIIIIVAFIAIIAVAVIGYMNQEVYQQSPQVESQSVEESTKKVDVEILGKWWDNELDVGRMLFKTEHDKYYHTLFNESGETGEYTPLILKEVSSELRYYFDDGNFADDYFIIDSLGHLNLFDKHGFIEEWDKMQ